MLRGCVDHEEILIRGCDRNPNVKTRFCGRDYAIGVRVMTRNFREKRILILRMAIIIPEERDHR